MMSQPDYFEVFPYHPQPAPFESLTGYLTRLAEGNALHTVQGLFVACFPTYLERMVIHIPADYPMAFWDALPQAARCSEDMLRRTTFYHLAEKFGCSARPQEIGIFLKDSIAYHFRYCPSCLAQYGYHSLTWRFLLLSGCDEHRCRLLNCCGHCGQSMPLFMKAPLKVGFCSHCRGDLRLCQAEPLPEIDWSQVARQRQDLEFLLSPTSDVGPDPRKHLGQRLVYWRLKHGLSSSTFAQLTGLPRSAMTGIEHGRSLSSGTSFYRYGLYAAHFDLSWQQLFAQALPPDVHTQKRQAKMEARQQREQQLVDLVQTAMAGLRAANQPLTQKAICQQAGWSIKGLRAYPRVKALLDQVIEQNRQDLHHNEQILVERVLTAIEQLTANHHPLTLQTIAKAVAETMMPGTLLRYPKVRAVIEAHLGVCCSPDFLEREAALTADVKQAISQLKANNQVVTQAAIARIVGLSVKGLKCYAKVRAVMKQVVTEQSLSAPQLNQARQQQLLSQVQGAIHQLEARQQPFTQKDIVRLIGTPLTTLRAYPDVKQLLAETAAQQRRLRSIQSQQRADRLLAQVRQAVQTLQASSQPLTQKRVGELVGVSPVTLNSYPPIKEHLQQFSRRRKHL